MIIDATATKRKRTPSKAVTPKPDVIRDNVSFAELETISSIPIVKEVASNAQKKKKTPKKGKSASVAEKRKKARDAKKKLDTDVSLYEKTPVSGMGGAIGCSVLPNTLSEEKPNLCVIF